MRTTKLERLSVLIEWLLLFTLLATPTITLMETWSHLFGGNDLLQDELNQIIHSSGSHILNGLNGVPLANGETPSLDRLPEPPLTMADYPLRTANRLLGTLVQLLPDLVFMLMLWQLRQLFRGYRHGLLFTFEQIRRYRQIGVLLCVSFLVELIQTPLLDTVLTISGPEIHGSVSISSSDFRLLLAGLIVLALALVMREAKLLADEQQLTV
ncbi:DUF2975 domain-containing protein [Aeromonas allosaccharophila]|uniref:DUF2975 domain-containing protein n=1 Tax=Aeromonas allosaccharophila TaxID=656 RepID=UPI003D25E10B